VPAATPIRNPASISNVDEARDPWTALCPAGSQSKGQGYQVPKIVLARNQSNALRDRLVTELIDLKPTEEAANWVTNFVTTFSVFCPPFTLGELSLS
jgi:hypothetical protein